MNRFIAAAVVGLALFGLAGAASAQTYDYTFTGTFTNLSGTATGQFRYDQATNTFSNVSITTTPGAGPFDPEPGHTYTVPVTVGPLPSSADELVAVAGPVGAGQSAIQLNFSPDLSQPAPVLVEMLELTCNDVICDNRSFNRQGFSVTTFTRTLVPAPVPTMTEWAMILFGTVLAGGAALYIQRRRFMA